MKLSVYPLYLKILSKNSVIKKYFKTTKSSETNLYVKGMKLVKIVNMLVCIGFP